jgi:uncharacterized protein YprB with RNaseH-like and TPR domain
MLTQLAIDLLNASRRLDAITEADFQGALDAIEKALGA